MFWASVSYSKTSSRSLAHRQHGQPRDQRQHEQTQQPFRIDRRITALGGAGQRCTYAVVSSFGVNEGMGTMQPNTAFECSQLPPQS